MANKMNEPKTRGIYLLLDHQDEGLVLAAANSLRSINRAARFYTGSARVAHNEWVGSHAYGGDKARNGHLLRVVRLSPEIFSGYRYYGHYSTAEDKEAIAQVAH
jgi:hypothetical protein